MPTYAQCEPVAALWQLVIARWNASTGQSVDAHDLRVTLLGDRGEAEAHALTEALWRVVHAATVWVIHCTAKAAREVGRGHALKDTPSAMLTRVPSRGSDEGSQVTGMMVTVRVADSGV